MKAFLFSPLLLATLPEDFLFRSAVPGQAATGAYVLFRAGDTKAACAAFVEQVRGGSTDPWAYWGTSICAADVAESRREVLTTWDALPQDSPLVLLARGYTSYQEGEMYDAEDRLRRAVTRAPNLALAWHALGVVVQERGDARAAIPLIEKALELSPELGLAKISLERALLSAAVFDRLLERLAELPPRWDELPAPRIPASGRSMVEVFEETSGAALQPTAMLTSVLTVTPLEDRERRIA
ncbi:MAG: hypothetical protein MI919_19405, partial [Holophagales bacterium]|nr:hypothetical protein [Holophagales bacterium]